MRKWLGDMSNMNGAPVAYIWLHSDDDRVEIKKTNGVIVFFIDF